MTEDRRRARLFALEVVGISIEFDLHRKRVRDAFAGLTSESSERLVAQGGATGLDVRVLSVALAGAAEALTIEWVLGRPQPSVDELIEQLSMIWIRAMQIDRFDPALAP
jgi:hypothetical protein